MSRVRVPSPAFSTWRFFSVLSGVPGAPPIPGDLNGDGVVDVFDLLILLSAWGECAKPGPGADCPADLNGDGVVDVFDLLMLLANWG